MAGFTLTASGTHGTIKLTSTNGSASGGQAYMAVGTLFTLQVSAPAFGGCSIFNVTSFTAQWGSGGGRFLGQTDYASGATLTTTTFNYSIVEDPFNSYTLTLPVVKPSVNINFYLGIPSVSFGGGNSLPDTISVTANYDNGQQDTASFTVNMQIPTMTMNFVFPTTSSTKFDFGPEKDYHVVGGTTNVYDNTRVAWGDSGFAAGTPLDQYYSFGATACGSGGAVWPFQWSGTGNNVTNSDGVFYFVQLVKGWSISEQAFHVDINRDGWTTVQDSADYIYPKTNPYGLDQTRDPTTGLGAGAPAPYYWTWHTYTNAPAGSGVLPVPGTGSYNDPNGNPISYYGDSPDSQWKRVSPYTPDVYYHRSVNYSLQSYFAFHPIGGIPIAMKGYNWGLNSNMDNPTAKSSLIWSQGVLNQSLWTSGGTTYVSPTSNDGPAYLKWDYVFGDLLDAQKGRASFFPRFSKILGGFFGGGAMPNSALMGGMIRIDANTGFKGLPVRPVGNLGTMNIPL